MMVVKLVSKQTNSNNNDDEDNDDDDDDGITRAHTDRSEARVKLNCEIKTEKYRASDLRFYPKPLRWLYLQQLILGWHGDSRHRMGNKHTTTTVAQQRNVPFPTVSSCYVVPGWLLA